jgi:hypothetical protein
MQVDKERAGSFSNGDRQGCLKTSRTGVDRLLDPGKHVDRARYDGEDSRPVGQADRIRIAISGAKALTAEHSEESGRNRDAAWILRCAQNDGALLRMTERSAVTKLGPFAPFR